ncbi:hypothetical protein JCM17846_11570 [Iodidimonas nitroreducens]|uniref:Uncharacterized protein n=1 Tax=Iodidimonas nitroreducens TaxID=1236968 RepID=A0A5A7N755_9PROT|nr:hypothetical protein JCM17846_11570 [Iodidimonas nitroreducens]
MPPSCIIDPCTVRMRAKDGLDDRNFPLEGLIENSKDILLVVIVINILHLRYYAVKISHIFYKNLESDIRWQQRDFSKSERINPKSKLAS